MYSKYIIKKGKRIGPYYYTSRRLPDGTIKTVYLGRSPKKEEVSSSSNLIGNKGMIFQKEEHYLVAAAFIIFALFMISNSPEFVELSSPSITGYAVKEEADGTGVHTLSYNINASFAKQDTLTVNMPNYKSLLSLKMVGETLGALPVISLERVENMLQIIALSTNEAVDGPFQIMDENGGKLDIAINLDGTKNVMNAPFSEIVLSNYQSGSEILIDSVKAGVVPPSGIAFSNIYAVDMQEIIFENARFARTAADKLLFICRLWDSNTNVCAGSWEQIQNISVGNEYDFVIDKNVFAFAEGHAEGDTVQQIKRTIFQGECRGLCSLQNISGNLDLFIDSDADGIRIMNVSVLYIGEAGNISTGQSGKKETPQAPKKGEKWFENISKEELRQKIRETENKSGTFRKGRFFITGINNNAALDNLIFEEKAERGPEWARVCGKDRCVHEIFNMPVNVLDIDGKYHPFLETVKVLDMGGNAFRISWRDNVVDVAMEGVDLSEVEIERALDMYEWKHRFNLTDLKVMPVTKVTANKKVSFDGSNIILEDIKISFNDVLDTGFDIESVPLDEKTYLFGIMRDYEAEGIPLGSEIEIDPTVILQNATNVTYDGDVQGNGTRTTVSQESGANFRVGRFRACNPIKTDKYRGFIDFNTTSIPDNSIIDEVNLTIAIKSRDDDGAVHQITVLDNFANNDTADGYPTNTSGSIKLFDDIENGPIYGNSMTLSAGAANVFTLGATANARLQGNLTQNFFSVGINNSIGSSENQACPVGDDLYTEVNATEDTIGLGGRPFLTVTYTLAPPEVTINSPNNETNFSTEGMFINATVTDANANTIQEIRFYGINTTSTITQEAILYITRNVNNGTAVTYNWTSPVILRDTSTVLLMHFDNNTDHGENRTRVVDFSREGNNGSITGGAVMNWTDAKIGGAYRFDGENDDINVGDQDELTGTPWTAMFWANPNDVTGNEVILGKTTATTGFAFQKRDSNLRVFFDSQTIGKFDVQNVFTIGTWVHIAATVDSGGNGVVYINGKQNQTNTSIIISGNNANFLIGQTGTLDYNGLIDELVIYNRSLSDTEIMDAYRLRTGRYYWYVNTTDNGGSTNFSDNRALRVDRVPVVNISVISPDRGNTTDNLTCNFTLTDDFATTLTAYVDFYNGSVLGESFTVNPVSNGTETLRAATLGLQAKNENWTCNVTPFDFAFNGTTNTSNRVTVVNSPPKTPSFISPADNNQTILLLPDFVWDSVIDPDLDPVNYTINVSCIGGCLSDNFIRNTTNRSFRPTKDLGFYHDDGFAYNWTIQSFDGENTSSFAAPRRFNVTAYVAITLVNDTADFGTMYAGDSNDTGDNSPQPISIQNDGNIIIYTNISVNQSLFQTVALPTANFQYRFSNRTELSSINATSTLTYTNFASGETNQTGVHGFNYSDANDLVELDINITIPAEEPTGLKQARITLTGYNK